MRQRSNKLLLRPVGAPTVAVTERKSIGSAQSLLLHAGAVRAGGVARERGGGDAGAGGVRVAGAKGKVRGGRGRLVSRHVGGHPSCPLVYRKAGGGYSLTREGVKGWSEQPTGAGPAVSGAGRAIRGERSSTEKEKVVGSVEGAKRKGDYSRARRGLSILLRRKTSAGTGSASTSAGARLLSTIAMRSSVTNTENSQRRAAAEGKVKLSLARARGVKGVNKWRRGGSMASPRAPTRRGDARGPGPAPAPGGATVTAVIHLCGKFIRTGKCPRRFAAGAARCTRRHDPDKVAVCTRWLAGTCEGERGGGARCALTHRAIPERMPVCSYFLSGTCAAPECPYLHVNVDPTSPVCQSFLRGYCARGLQCRMRHTLVCPASAAGGTCPNRAACRFHHPTNNRRGVKRARPADETEREGGSLPPSCEPCDGE